MITTVKNKQFEFTKLPITEQLIFLIDYEPELKESKLLDDKKHNAIIGALLADLFLMRKVGLVNNKVVVTAMNESTIDYIDGFITKLRTIGEKKFIQEIIYEEKPLAEGIEQNIRDKLVAEDWLSEKKSIIPFLSQKELQVESKDVLKDEKRKMISVMEKKIEPEKKEIYLLAILQAINLLNVFVKGQTDEKKVQSRLNEMMSEEYLAQMIHDAIKNQPELETKPFSTMSPPGYIAGMGGFLSR